MVLSNFPVIGNGGADGDWADTKWGWREATAAKRQYWSAEKFSLLLRHLNVETPRERKDWPQEPQKHTKNNSRAAVLFVNSCVFCGYKFPVFK